MMRSILRSRFFMLFALLTVLSVAACGSNAGSSGNTPSSQPTTPSAPAATPTSPSGGTTTPTQTTATTGQIQLAPDKATYGIHDTITITVTNKTGQPLFVWGYYTNCTLVQLEKASNTSWVTQGRCLTQQPQSFTKLASDSTTQYRLTPSIGGFSKPSANASWQPGTYRVVLKYTLAPNEENLPGTSVESASFTVEQQ